MNQCNITTKLHCVLFNESNFSNDIFTNVSQLLSASDKISNSAELSKSPPLYGALEFYNAPIIV